MRQYQVTGMSCAACSTRVERAVTKVPGVTSCSVSLLTNSMGVDGEADPEEVIRAVKEAGYGASEKGKDKERRADVLEDTQTPLLIRRLLASIVFLVLLMYLSMGHRMWHLPIPAALEKNVLALALIQMLLAGIVMIINQRFFISGFRGLIHKNPNMDTLVALGSFAAFGYSTYLVFVMTACYTVGQTGQARGYLHELYFESAAMILTLITVGKVLESRAKGKTTNAIRGLMKLAPKTARVIRQEEEYVIPVEQVQKRDIFVVRPGEQIPVDGIVLEGGSAVDESAMTGESIPVDKKEGDQLCAATINQSGFLRCEATQVGEDTTLSQIIQMVSDAAATKAPIAKTADRVSGIFVPIVISLAFVTGIVWLLAGQTFGFALERAISVLVISCPCALGLATPVAIMVGNGVGAGKGILFKTAMALEEAGKIQIVALDKTGTITRGKPRLTDLLPADGISEEELYDIAYSLEIKSEHPLAKAIVKDEKRMPENPEEITEFQALAGYGLIGRQGRHQLAGGSLSFIEERAPIPQKFRQKAQNLSEQGKTPLFFAKDEQLAGVIAVADVIKEDSAQAIRELKGMGMDVVMLTGDNERTAKAIGNLAGVDQVIAGVLPGQKESVIRTLQERGKTAMVGDGINDAPALTTADLGIAIGTGTDIAMDAADIVLMKSSLSDVCAAIRLSRATLFNIHENLFWAFFYNMLGIPLAAGVFLPLFGWRLSPMFGALAMSLSSFCVVTNALRLNFKNIYDSSHDRKRKVFGSGKNKKRKESEDSRMTKTMKIEGMMCEHCEARVKKALESLSQVEQAAVSHKEGTAVVTLSGPVEDEVLKKAVEEQDYQVMSVEEE